MLTITSSVSGGSTDLKDSEGNDSGNLLSDRTYYAKGDYQIKVSVTDTNFDFGYETEDENGNPKKL